MPDQEPKISLQTIDELSMSDAANEKRRSYQSIEKLRNSPSLSDTPQVLPKKKPVFSRASTIDASGNKSMIVETETVDATATQNVLPINQVPSDTVQELLLPPTSTMPPPSSTTSLTPKPLSDTHTSLRNKKSTLLIDSTVLPATLNGAGASSINLGQTSGADDDIVSVAGSIRTRRDNASIINLLHSGSAPEEEDINVASGEGMATKADFFAARVARAVDNENSDSEETFVYENTPADQVSSTKTPQCNSSPRNSMAAVEQPVPKSSIPIVTANPNLLKRIQPRQNLESPTPSNMHLNSPERPRFQFDGPLNETQSENNIKFPTKRISLVSLAKGDRRSNRELRATTSKLFDSKGVSLRRYSGVPDDMEDYLDQYDHNLDDSEEMFLLNQRRSQMLLPNDSSSHLSARDQLAHQGFYHEDEEVDLEDYYGDHTREFDGGLYHYDGHPDELTPLKNNRKEWLYGDDIRRQANGKKVTPRYASTYDPGSKKKNDGMYYYSPHNFYRKKKLSLFQKFKNFMFYVLIMCAFVSVGFIGGFILATAKDLNDVQLVALDNVLISYDELIMDAIMSVFNPSMMSLKVYDVELDVFAKSSHLPDNISVLDSETVSLSADRSGNYQTVLLGTIHHFESPLHFAGGFFNRKSSISTGVLKLLHPGTKTVFESQDASKINLVDDREKWKVIMDYEFELIVRGTISYSIPFYNTKKAAPVSASILVLPEEDPSAAVN